MNVQDQMSALIISGEKLEEERNKETTLIQARIAATTDATLNQSSTNFALENQLLSLRSQIKTNQKSAATENTSETDVEASQQTLLEQKKSRIVELSKTVDQLQALCDLLEERIGKEQGLHNPHDPQIIRLILWVEKHIYHNF
jgi:HJR/Mrr/RecB family endonuclease